MLKKTIGSTGHYLLLLGLGALNIEALAQCEVEAGHFVSIQGTVEIQDHSGTSWQAANLDDPLCGGDLIRTGLLSRAAVALANESVLRIDQDTTISLDEISPDRSVRSLLRLVTGAIMSFSRKPRQVQVSTIGATIGIRGTEFVLRATDDKTEVSVFEGEVAATNDHGELLLTSGQSALAATGRAPELRTVVRPRDEVQWSLYYPPILSFTDSAEPSGPISTRALECARRNDTACAFAELDAVPTTQRNADYHLVRAALLLSVGRVDQARQSVNQALTATPESGHAHALGAVIAVAQNDVDQALSDGQRGVELSPGDAAARIALSYAQQASLDLKGARETLAQAVKDQPQSALAWARLAEIELSLGERKRALEAADRAVALSPDLSRTQLVLGFAALGQMRIDAAQQAFERAIELDSADPLARLGLGLAKIRKGKLAAGRSEIEAAVALDSNHSLLRAYLGKSYFEEKRGPLDSEQLASAKNLDPNDPTAYLYDAIRKQTENRPGEALSDIEDSIAKNDNRAVYRSRLLLDQDRAARGTSLARTYNTLGFTKLGLNESRRSLALDPSNPSAHRFLSDSYGGVRRREISRVSELLQAQMLQDININPVQPSISSTNLNIITSGGPSEVGFNEFTPLFERNKAQFSGTGQAGNFDTYAGEGIVSAIYDRFSISAFHYETDGWRPNNQLDQDIYNVFAQAALTPEFSAQVEFRRRDSDEGDLDFNFDPTDFAPNQTISREQDTARIGLRWSPTPRSNVLFSYIHGEQEAVLNDRTVIPGIPIELFPGFFIFGTFTLTADIGVMSDGDQFEGQYLYSRDWFNLVAGVVYSEVDRERDGFSRSELDLGFDTIVEQIPAVGSDNITHPHGYIYGNAQLWGTATVTLGVSYDEYEQEGVTSFDLSSANPKFGLQWQIAKAVTVRAAVFKTVKPVLVNNRTLEPTQVAGFNQFFDDADATESWRYGVGLDWRPLPDLFLGGEATVRDMDEETDALAPVAGGPPRAVFEDRDEERHQIYAFWLPVEQLAVHGSLVYDRYEAQEGIATQGIPPLPLELETFSVPIGLRYFAPSGLFASVAGTYVDQKLLRDADPQADGTQAGEFSDAFFVVDLGVGYRFPNRTGAISLDARNLLGEEFMYQDDSFREFRDEPSTGPYFPERTVLVRLTLSF
jgi:tetratricopeptide (TPR) repeat protein